MRAALAAIAVALLFRGGSAQQTVFRSFADSVALDVLVTDGKRAVRGLTAADFEVTDNGVRQTVVDVTHETVPLDVTLSVDISDSIREPLLGSLVAALNRVREQLRAEDRISVRGFNERVNERVALAPARTVPAIKPPATGGQTSLYDAIAVALVSAADADRRQMAIVFTDGLDTMSFLGEEDVLAIAQRSRTALFFVAAPAVAGRIPAKLMEEVAGTTGGMVQIVTVASSYTVEIDPSGAPMIRSPGGSVLAAGFLRALQDFRTSYAVRYIPEGVARLGWHEVAVRATQGRKPLQVRARRGYAVDR